jgi:hypothetical protein
MVIFVVGGVVITGVILFFRKRRMEVVYGGILIEKEDLPNNEITMDDMDWDNSGHVKFQTQYLDVCVALFSWMLVFWLSQKLYPVYRWWMENPGLYRGESFQGGRRQLAK